MDVRMISIALVCGISALAGCGGGDHAPPAPAVTTQIFSDSSFDGDIALTASNTYAVTQGMSSSVQSVFAGIDPGQARSTGPSSTFR